MSIYKNSDLNIVHSDAVIAVVEKQGGLLSVPGRGPDKQDCIAERVKAFFPGCIEQPAVHRLDQDTSGLMVFGLSKESHRNLSIQFEKKLVKKRYIALLEGIINEPSGRIELAFRLDIENRPYQIYDPVDGKPGVSLWRRIKIEGNKTRIEFSPLTGRTHQLRLHSAHELGLGCPIEGDRLYGNGRIGDKLKLHASYLAFTHPITDMPMVFESESPF